MMFLLRNLRDSPRLMIECSDTRRMFYFNFISEGGVISDLFPTFGKLKIEEVGADL